MQSQLEQHIDYAESRISDLMDVVYELCDGESGQEFRNVKEDEANTLHDQIKQHLNDAKDTAEEMCNDLDKVSEELEEIQDILDENTIDTVRGEGVCWKADNLIDQQIMEAMQKLMSPASKLSALKLLDILDNLVKEYAA